MPGGNSLLRMIRSYRFHQRVGWDKSLQDIFTRYFQTNGWSSGESLSGPGSTLEYTENIRKHIPILIERLGVHTLLDAPCGDYNWFRLISHDHDMVYIGGDIVEPMIARNRALYSNENTSFVHLDITKDPLPSADLYLCRDVLFHLSEREIFMGIDNFLSSDITWLLTSSHPQCRQNSDIPTGSFRLLNLELPPFSFGKPITSIDDWIEGWPVRSLCLWDRQTLRERLASNKALRRVVGRR